MLKTESSVNPTRSPEIFELAKAQPTAGKCDTTEGHQHAATLADQWQIGMFASEKFLIGNQRPCMRCRQADIFHHVRQPVSRHVAAADSRQDDDKKCRV